MVASVGLYGLGYGLGYCSSNETDPTLVRDSVCANLCGGCTNLGMVGKRPSAVTATHGSTATPANADPTCHCTLLHALAAYLGRPDDKSIAFLLCVVCCAC
jgi:hypothetical protein